MLRKTNLGLFSRGIEVGANIATMVVACLLLSVLVKMYFIPRSSIPPTRPPDLAAAFVGKSLASQLPGIDWSHNGRTVVLALSTHCHFCTASAPFFRKLSGKSGKDFKIVAVLPQSLSESREYLHHEGVQVDQVKEISLGQVGVMATPTMLLLNNSGIVRKAWIGELNPDQQKQALNAIGAFN